MWCRGQKNYSRTLLLLYLVFKMLTEHHILKAISSCPIFYGKPSGNVFSWVNFLSCDSVLSMTKIRVNIGKGQGHHVSAVSFNPQNDFKTFSCPMKNHRQRFWQKTTWATIMCVMTKHALLHIYCSICTKIW